MDISKLNGLLSGMEILNSGCNQNCEYAIYPLPDADSLMVSLGVSFSSLRTSNVPPQPPENWHIQAIPLGVTWRETVTESLFGWFFRKVVFLQKVYPSSQDAYVNYVLKCLVEAIGESDAYEVIVQPPMFYDCLWEDFAFVSPQGKWILHLGFSD